MLKPHLFKLAPVRFVFLQEKSQYSEGNAGGTNPEMRKQLAVNQSKYEMQNQPSEVKNDLLNQREDNVDEAIKNAEKNIEKSYLKALKEITGAEGKELDAKKKDPENKSFVEQLEAARTETLKKLHENKKRYEALLGVVRLNSSTQLNVAYREMILGQYEQKDRQGLTTQAEKSAALNTLKDLSTEVENEFKKLNTSDVANRFKTGDASKEYDQLLKDLEGQMRKINSKINSYSKAEKPSQKPKNKQEIPVPTTKPEAKNETTPRRESQVPQLPSARELVTQYASNLDRAQTLPQGRGGFSVKLAGESFGVSSDGNGNFFNSDTLARGSDMQVMTAIRGEALKRARVRSESQDFGTDDSAREA